jgi:hypothetical protein
MACQEESVPSFTKMVVLHDGRASYMCILLASSFLIKLTSVVLRNRFLNVARRSRKCQASVHLLHSSALNPPTPPHKPPSPSNINRYRHIPCRRQNQHYLRSRGDLRIPSTGRLWYKCKWPQVDEQAHYQHRNYARER